jgi:hypothetical protein
LIHKITVMTAINPYTPPNPRPEDDPPLVAQLAVEGEGMTVEFEQTFEDHVVLSDYHLRQQPKLRQHLLGLVGLFVLLMTGFLTARPGMDWNRIWSAGAAGFVSGSVLVAMWIYRTLARRYLIRRNLQRLYAGGKNLSVVGQRRITITPEFVMCAAPLSQSVHRWAGVEKVRADQDGIYIFNTSLSAFVLPRRAFHSEQHFHDFAATAEKYLRQGWSSSPK